MVPRHIFYSLVVIGALLGSTYATLPVGVPYQAHGFNGIPYFHQQLVKGVKWFKIDFVYNVKQGCQDLSSWTEDLNACEPYDTLEVCCLAMRGDASGFPWLSGNFNTSYDLVDYFNSDSVVKVLNKDVAKDTAYVFVNFNSSIDGVSAMITNLLYGVQKAITDNNLNLKIQPGFGGYMGNLASKCQDSCSDQEKAINEYSWLDDGDFVNYDVTDESDLCSEGFPESDYPYRLYEPSDAETIHDTATQFLSAACKKAADRSTLSSGLRITSNLEPENLQVYLADLNEDPVLKTANKLIQKDATVAFGRVKQDDGLFVSVRSTASGNMIDLYSLESSKGFAQIYQNTMEGNGTGEVQAISMAGNYLLAHYKESSVIDIFEIVAASKAQHVQSFDMKSTTLLSGELLATNDKLYHGSISMNTDDILTLTINEINLESQGVTLVVSQDMDLKLSLTAANLQGASISLIPDQTTSDEIHGVITLSHTTGGYPELYYIFLDSSLSQKTITPTIPAGRSDFGTTQTIGLMYGTDGELFMFDIHTDGLCQCGQAMNNIDQDECSIGSRFDSGYGVLASVSGKINYNWARYNDFKAAVQSQKPLGGCHSTVLHAKLTTGTTPSGGVYIAQDGSTKGVFVNSSLHKFEYLDSMVCGRASNFDAPGLYVNSFDLLNMEDFDRI